MGYDLGSVAATVATTKTNSKEISTENVVNTFAWGYSEKYVVQTSSLNVYSSISIAKYK